MRWLCRVLFAGLLLGLAGCDVRETESIASSNEPQIRVLLVGVSDKDKVPLAVTGPYYIANAQRNKIAYGNSLDNSLAQATATGIVIANRAFALSHVAIVPQGNAQIIVGDIPYFGEIHLYRNSGKLRVLNVLSMEDYLCGVIGSEMPLYWPDEALQAQAIVARTYALYERTVSRNKQREFDVYDTVASQVYKGAKTATLRAQTIVKSTRGIVMLYDNRVFKAFFHSTCGGHTASARDVFAYQDISPLAGRVCPYCRDGKYFNWQCALNSADLQLLLRDLELAPPFTRMIGDRRDQGGRLVTVKIYHGQDKVSTVSAPLIRQKLVQRGKQLRSCKFSIAEEGGGMLISGNGWGHGVGMCQVGAYKMAQEGTRARDIIDFYYPAVTLYRIWE